MGHGLRFLRQDRHVAHSGQKPRRSVGPGDPRPSRGGQGGLRPSRTLDEIRPGYQFNETCQETVPQAIIAFLESRNFEDAIRNAISLGGDSDTLAAITGSIAEAAYGIPDWIEEKALSYLDAPLLDVVVRWKQYLGSTK